MPSVSAAAVAEALASEPRLAAELVESLVLPARKARFGEPDPALPEPLVAALAAGGVERLWRHQARGLDVVRAGGDLLLVTPTASGKSLVFQLPVLEAALAGRPGRALFLYPLKALGRDQREKLEALGERAGLAGEPPLSAVYDGDTPGSERRRIKAALPRVLITNPDMLHLGILGHWQSWTAWLEELEWIVLDELHAYRGLFGSHFHHVLMRLERLCRSLGARPRVIASSATAGNAEEFAARLLGRRVVTVSESGAPREARRFLFFRPEASPYTTALELTRQLLDAGLKTIVFTKARRITELLYSWLEKSRPELARRVASYRSGFLPEERRRIEADLFAGRLDGVISTSALEMGIDVGGLDACVLVGYPGSVMATWQRSGRVGRGGRESLTCLVALPDALDQYLVDHPEEVLEGPLERLVVDPGNEPVTRGHLVCAAAEKPLSRADDGAYLGRHAAVVGDLLRDGELREAGGELHSRLGRPHRDLSLRGTGATYTVVAEPGGRTVGTVDGARVLHECHPGAVYLHAGRQYQVSELDLDRRQVRARPVSLDWFTTPSTEKDTEILEILDRRRDGRLAAWLGRVRVTERVTGFERKRLRGQEVIDHQELDLPPVRFETTALWWTAPPWLEASLRRGEHHFLGSLHAAEHATISLLPLLALCDRGDVGGISFPLHPQLRTGGVFVYDGHPGGVGIARRGFEELPELLGRVADRVGECACETGCPACIQSPKCGNGNRPLDKPGSVLALELLLGRREPRVAPEEVPAPDLDLTAGDGGEGEGPAAGAREGGRGRSGRGAEAGAVEGADADREGDDEAPGDAGRGSGSRRGGTGRPISGIAWWEWAGPVAWEGRPAGEPQARRKRSAGGGRRLTAVPGRGAPPRARPRRPARPRQTVLFDLETARSAKEVGGWARTYRMRMAIGVALHLEEGRFETFGEEQVEELVARLEAADLVVGFNVERFDYGVLSGYTGIDYVRRLPTLDLLEEVHRLSGVRPSMQALAEETLGEGKSADGLQSLEWVRQGRLDRVAEYCRRDVEVLRDLYLFGRRMGYVVYRDREGHRVRVGVEW